MSEDKKKPVNEQPLSEFIAEQKADKTWRKAPWVNRDTGEVFRKNRIQNPDGTFTVFDVKVEPKGGK